MAQNTAVRLPSKESLEKAIDIVTTGEAAEFFHLRLKDQLTKAKVEGEFSQLLADTQNLASTVGDEQPNSDAWAGTIPATQTGFQRYQAHLAKESFENLTGKTIRFDYAVSHDAEIIRAYTEDGNSVGNEEAQLYDNLFNSWLAQQDLLTKDGVIYEAAASGEIQQKNNQNKRASAERIRELIEDQNSGFKKFVESKGDSTQFDVIQHEHPTDEEKKRAEQDKSTPS